MTALFERALARLFQAAYKRRPRAIVETAPTWVSEEILSASERIGGRRAVLWISENQDPWPTDQLVAWSRTGRPPD